jgi:hypothetical protein
MTNIITSNNRTSARKWGEILPGDFFYFAESKNEKPYFKYSENKYLNLNGPALIDINPSTLCLFCPVEIIEIK